jgi:signal transduction histidine kinase/CheY-like chemotaxis protein
VRDLVTLVVEVCFAVVFGQALAAYLRRRDALQRDVMWVFTAMAVIFVLDVWRRVAGPPPAWVGGASAVLLLAQPYLTLRMVARLRPVPVWLRRGALGGYVITAGPFVTGATLPAPLVLSAVAVFVAVQAGAAGFLYTEARRRSGSPRVRLFAAAAGTATFALAILAAGAGAAGGTQAAVVTGYVALAVALVSASAYLVAFVPPRWLRRSWSTAAAYTLTRRLLHAPAGEGPERTWQRYADAVCEVAGVDFAIVLLESPGEGVREVAAARTDHRSGAAYRSEDLARLLATPSPMTTSPPGRGVAPLAVTLAGRVGARYVTAVPLGIEGQDRGALVVLNVYRRLFAADDVTVLGELGEQANLLAQRGGLLAEHERLNAELAASVDALSLAGKAKSDFLGSMSHELRTPLNAIIGFSDLMDPDDADPGEQQRLVPAEWVRHIRTSGRHLLNLINDILDLAKVEAGRIDLKPEPLPLPTTIAEVITTLRPVSDRKQLQVSTDIPALTVWADRIRLRQVLDNLLSNAIKFTPESGSIHLSAARTETEVRITVADTGVGIAVEDQKAVFDEFTQVGDPAARQAGTGLGLTLTRRLIEAHGGSIELQSQPGIGSQFTICLPSRGEPPNLSHIDTDTDTDTAAVAGEAAAVTQPGAVLVIEDDPAAADLLAAYLTDVGYPAAVASTGQRGIDYARRHQPQAILLDILLPDADGWQVLRELKNDPATRHIPIIVTTVLEHHEVGLALGAVDYLTKPVNPDALVAVLTRHALLPPPPATATVLAIDDDPAALDLITATLQRHGAATATATTGTRGLDLARRRRHDLIICDMLLPDTDGFAIIAALHADPDTRDTPIIVLTGCDLTDTDKARLSGRVIDIVHKGDAARHRLAQWLAHLHPAPRSAGDHPGPPDA